MTSDLVHRMRTCASALMTGGDNLSALHRDAADLLAEASNLLDEPDDPGEPMEILEPAPQAANAATWTTLELPTRPVELGAYSARPCPGCGSIDIRKVTIANRKLKLTCPRCARQWEYGR